MTLILRTLLSAVGTAVAAVGVLAAFATLRMAQTERRDQLANQARLIIVETVSRAEMVPPANQVPDRSDMLPEYRYAIICNHSQQPIFNVRIPRETPRQPSQRKTPKRWLSLKLFLGKRQVLKLLGQ